MRRDIVFALRVFLRERGLFGVTIAGLALAIGVSTAVFTVLNAYAFRGYGVTDPASVFRLALDNRLTGPTSKGASSPMTGVWAHADYERLALSATSSAVAASEPSGGTFRDRADQDTGRALRYSAVSGTYFAVMGGRASIGRVLAATDDATGAAPVAVLSHAFWTQTLHADASIVGRPVWIDDTPFVVVGVAARFFTGPTDSGAPPFWIAMAAERDLEAARASARMARTRTQVADLRGRSAGNAADGERLRTLEAELSAPVEHWNPPVTVYGRPAPGVSRMQLAAEVTAAAAAFAAERGRAVPTDRDAVRLESLQELHAKAALPPRVVFMVAGAIALVILLASANLANLLLAGAVRRGREIGTRLALGASRGRIVRQLLTESLLLGVLGSAGGLLIAAWIAPVFARIALRYPARLDLAPDLTTYLFVTGLAIAVGVAAGLAPARFSRRGDLASALKADQAGGPGLLARSHLRSILIGSQTAGSVVLLVVAALLTRAVVRAATFDLGFDVNHLIEVSVGLSGGYDQARTDAYWQAAIDRVRQLPGVAAAATTEAQPFSSFGPQRWQGGRVGYRETTSAEYFETIGLRVLEGRAYSADEVRTHANVAVISASVARLYWGGADPLGADLDRVWGTADPADARRGGILRKPAGTLVVGVVADAITFLENYDAPTIYMPSESLHANTQLVVRSRADPVDIVGAVRDALRSIDPEQRPDFYLLRDRFRNQLEEPRRLATLSAIIGATAIGLAAIGLFGVTAFVAGQRRQEVGVRIALGAGRGDVVRLLVRDSLRPVVMGLSCGLLLALWAGQVLQGALYGLSGRDPMAMMAGVAVLLTSAIAAAYLPARRAARVDPAAVLRAQ